MPPRPSRRNRFHADALAPPSSTGVRADRKPAPRARLGMVALADTGYTRGLSGCRPGVSPAHSPPVHERFKRTIEKLGLLTELRAREFYEKPTSERKRKKAAAVKRHFKRVRSMQLPKKLY